MKWVFGIGGTLAGAALVLLMFRLGAVDFADGMLGMQQEPAFTLPTYLTFIGVMLTAVTVVLAAVAVGIGVLAAFTIQEMRERLDNRVDNALDDKLTEEALGDRIDALLRKRQNPTVAELEEGFDPADQENR